MERGVGYRCRKLVARPPFFFFFTFSFFLYFRCKKPCWKGGRKCSRARRIGRCRASCPALSLFPFPWTHSSLLSRTAELMQLETRLAGAANEASWLPFFFLCFFLLFFFTDGGQRGSGKEEKGQRDNHIPLFHPFPSFSPKMLFTRFPQSLFPFFPFSQLSLELALCQLKKC